MKKLFLATALLFSVFAIAQQRTIDVTGNASKILAPDFATISIEISAENKEAQLTLDEMNKASANALAYLKKQKGIERIQTERLNINQVNRYNNTKPEAYRASQTISFRLTDFSAYESVIVKLFSLGVNGIQSISFDSTERENFENELLQAALKNAKTKASLMANTLGAEVGEVVYISDNTTSNMPTPRMYAMADAALKSSIAAPEELGISTQIKVTFTLK